MQYGRPPTGSLVNRTNTRNGLPPNTAGIRPPTSLGALRTRNGEGIAEASLKRSLNDRPVTQQGLGFNAGSTTLYTSHGGGLNRLATATTRRLVQDKSYFLGEIAHRTTLITTEMNKLNAELHVLEHDNSNYDAFEQKVELLKQSLKERQRHLGDLNLLIEKLHNGGTLQSIEKEAASLESQTVELETYQSQTLKKRQQLESELKKLEKSIQPYIDQLEAQLDNLPVAKESEISSMESENARLEEELKQTNSKYDELRVKSSKIQRFLDAFPAQMEALERDSSALKAQIKEKTKLGHVATTSSSKPLLLVSKDSSSSLNMLSQSKSDISTGSFSISSMSPEQMAEELVKMTEQVKMLEAQEAQLNLQVTESEHLIESTLAHTDFISNVPGAKLELERSRVELVRNLDSRKSIYEKLHSSLSESEQKLKEKQRFLEKSETFQKIESLQKRLSLLNEKTFNIKKAHDQLIVRSNYMPSKQQVLTLSNLCSSQQQSLLQSNNLVQSARI